MKGKSARLGVAVMMVVLGIALAGCAAAPSSSPPKSQDDLLTAAGFTSYVANTPQSLAYLKTLPPQEIVQHRYKGANRYLVCTDQNSRACYVGDEAAFLRYQNLANQADIAASKRTVKEERWDPEAQLLYMDSQGGGR
jgi:ABC-type phosphate transport system substrate-binding protein